MTRSQQDRILCYLATGKPLTPIMALRLFGSFRLGARIYELKKQGHRITKQMVHRRGKTFAEYRLE